MRKQDMAPTNQLCTLTSARLLLLLTLLVSVTNTVLADETKWIAVGSLHSWYSSAGSERELGRTGLIYNQQDGLRWPAQHKWQDTEAAKALWIGATNYYDPLVNQTFDYKVVHVGPRVLNEDEFIPVEFKLVGRFNHPTVIVDDAPASDMMLDYDVVDEIDPALPADRMVYNVVNTGMGITVTRKIYAFTNPYHDNYFIYDYVFKNTGICNQDSSITHDQTLGGVVFFFQYRYAATREACSYGYHWLPQSTTWGHSTVNDVVYEHPLTGEAFRAHFAWLGLHSGAGYDNIGAPYWSGDGHLGAAQYVGAITLHADVSVTDNSDDPGQPFTTDYLQSDLPITSGNDQFNAEQMAEEYAAMTAGHPENTHAEDMGCPTPIDCAAFANLYVKAGDPGNPGGYTQSQGFGPYTLDPGDSIHVVIAEGVAGLSRELHYTIGVEWLNGSGPFTLPDGSTTSDADYFKNAWVYTGQDSIFQTFERAIENYNSGFSIPQPPPPPSTFEVVSGTDRITLVWDENAEAWPGFAGYKIYRAVGRYDTTYQEIFACGLGSDHPGIVNSYEDTTVIQERDYYYYIVSFDDGSTNDIRPGVPLQSSMFWTRTNQPAFLRSGIDADLYVAPNGSDENSGLTPNQPLQTITAALDRIFASSLSPHTIYLAEGTYSPSTNGETYPLDCKSYVSLAGAGEATTILDGQETGGILNCVNARNLVVQNLTIQHGVADAGGGINCASSDLFLSNVTITENSAMTYGGGIYLQGNSSVAFDSSERCNISMNSSRGVGHDLYAFENGPSIDVVVDTFTVMHPTDYYAYSPENFTFDILNYKVEQIEADLYVAADGNDENSGLSADDPLQTITYALMKTLADSLHPHTIHLAEGTYSPSTNGENYPLYCRSHLSFSGAGLETTVLDAEGTGRVLYSQDDHDFAIEDLTLRNGLADFGGGIYLTRSDPVLTNLTISGNTASNGGGGIYLSESGPILTNLTLIGNSAETGGGVDCTQNSNLTLSGVTVVANSASSAGAGISCRQNSTMSLSGTMVNGNWAFAHGGGIYLSHSSVSFDSINRSNIFLNSANVVGNDLYAGSGVPTIHVVVDTFSVLYPTDDYTYPLDNFTFDILNYKIEQAEADLYVAPNGSNSNTGLSADEPLGTITYALELIFADSPRPHTIYLAEGTYSPSTNGESYPLHGKSYVSLSGTSEETTILDAEGSGGVLYLSAAHHLAIENLTMQNGIAEYGGGIYFESSSPTLTNVTITGDSAQYGGGIYCTDNSNPILVDVTINGNAAGSRGGGLYCQSSSPILDSVSINENSAGLGGGLVCNNNSNPILNKVIISGNSASWGGGIRLDDSSPILVNVTSTANSSAHFGGIHSVGDCNPVLVNSVFWNPTEWEIVIAHGSLTISHSDMQGSESGVIAENVNWLEGNIDADPLFVDPELGDFNLQEDSPCVDAGTAFFVWGGDTLVDLPDSAYNGNAPDMGAFESPYSAEISQNEMLPRQFVLYANYPNPFNPITTLRYDLPRESKVQLVIYDILGRKVRILVNETETPGRKSVKWTGRDDLGRPVASGVYLYRIVAGDFMGTKKMILIK